MRYLRIGCLAILAALILTPGAAAASEAAVIDSVELQPVREEWAVNTNVENRIIASIQAVCDKLLIGRQVEDVEYHKYRFEGAIRQVFDRVLYGFEIDEVTITPDRHTVIKISLIPWGDVVQSVDVQFYAEGIDPEAQALMWQDLTGIDQRIAQIMVGMPVEAFAWADVLNRAMIREMLDERLPEFRATIECTPDVRTMVVIRLEPAGPLIKKYDIRLRSDSVPKLLLLPIGSAAELAADKMEGLPVAFVQRHRKDYIESLHRAVSSHARARQLNLTVEGDYDLAEKTLVEIQAETTKYKIDLEGVLDLGRSGNDNIMVRGHLGYIFRPSTEVFLHVEFYPNSISWHLQPGIGIQFTPKVYAAIRYDLRDEEEICIFRYQLANDLWLDLERNLSSGQNLTGVRYWMHDYLSTEAMVDGKKAWIRLIVEL